VNLRNEMKGAGAMIGRLRMRRRKQSRQRFTGLGAAAAFVAVLAATWGASPASATAKPALAVKAVWGDTHLPPGGEGQFTLMVRNAGDATASGEDVTVTDQLPAGVTVESIEGALNFLCGGQGTSVVSCTFPSFFLEFLLPAPGPFVTQINAQPTGFSPLIIVNVSVDAGASGTGLNVATVSGGGSEPFTDEDPVTISATPSSFGFVPGSVAADVFGDRFPLGERLPQAGARPYELRVNFDFNQESGIHDEGETADHLRYTGPHGRVRTTEVTLPRGFLGNPEATPKCEGAKFATPGVVLNSTQCPSNTQVGYINIYFGNGKRNYGFAAFTTQAGFAMLTRVPIYNVEPPRGAPAAFAFNAGGFVQGSIYPTLDPARGYAIKTVTPNVSNLLAVKGVEVTFWGVPGDPAHDRDRYHPEAVEGLATGASFGQTPIRPLLTNAMDCGFENGGFLVRADSYRHPGAFTPMVETEPAGNVTGCDDPRIRFNPDVAIRPTSRDAGSPTGLDVHLKVPQRNDEVPDATDLYEQNGDVQAIPSPPLKKAVVTFPEGMTVNPSAAQGLGSCSPAQIGLGTDRPVTCPDNSQYGTLTLHTPILPVDNQPTGQIYIAKQNDNPFHNFLSLYLVIQEPDRGILIKIPGRVDLDPVTGQITTTFDDLPQFPMSNMEMNLKGGLRAGLVNPQTCGKKTITATFYSWHEPTVPKTVNSSYEIVQNSDGGPCLSSLADRPFEPELSGGSLNPLAGAFSPLALRMIRTDLEQELSVAEGTAPPGLLASLRGVGRCSDGEIAAAAAPGRSGIEEQANPSCPASSLVGRVEAGAGVGQVLTYVHGHVYMAGPYKGAPVSGVAIVPAVGGPFDLGVIVTRAPAYINPRTGELRLRTDELPLIFKGIPVRVRDIRVNMDRPNFILNPTSCAPMTLAGTLFSSEGKSRVSGSRFQAADCASLGFKPRLGLRLTGGTKRGAHPSLRAVFMPRPGHANLRRAAVTLPRSAFLDQAHIRTICTRAQFATRTCPKASIYGRAVAHTPLLDKPLRGPVYLRSSDNPLPDMVLDLRGEVDVEAVARIDSVRGAIRSTFAFVPDAPISKVVLRMAGGKRGLIVNSRNLCVGKPARARANLRAHNGRRSNSRPVVHAVNCKKQRKGAKGKGRGR
jgi:uncharacterized repeat protein (TIGR01451 family)